MTTQADRLQDRLGGRRRRRAGPSSVLAVASGRGGAGVSLVAAALALRSAARGVRTLLVDADPWLDVQRIWLGAPRGRPLDTLRTGVDPESLVVEVGGHFELVSLGSGQPSEADARSLVRRIPSTYAAREVVVVDTGSGLEALERALDLNAGTLLCVTGADPVGLAATHALLKACAAWSQVLPVVLFNRVHRDQAAAGEAVLTEGGRRYLGFEPATVGALPTDGELQRLLSDGGLLPESLATTGVVRHIDRIMHSLPPWRSVRHDG